MILIAILPRKIAYTPAAMEHGFLQDLAVVMIVAGVVTILFHFLKQPVVLGYILAGLIVGPYTPSIPLSVHDQHTIEIMSELGMILLMFSLGLHFSIRSLAQVGLTAFIAATLEIVLMLASGYAVGRLFGWSSIDSLFLGAILSISSTTIITKALEELGLTKERFAKLIFGILVVEDILAIAMIVLLSGFATTGELAMGRAASELGKLGLFLIGVLALGFLGVPLLLRFVSRFKSNEVLLITALALCFGVSLLAISMGYSVALGAFLIGAVIAEARERGKIDGLIAPIRDMFSAIFFVAIGMMIQPKMIVEYFVPIVVISLVVIIGKVISCSVGTLISGNDGRTSMRVGMGLAQIGEFSFIIASLGLTLKVTSDFLYPIAVSVSAITTLCTPYLIRSSDYVANLASRLVPGWAERLFDQYRQYTIRLGESQSRIPIVRTIKHQLSKMFAQPEHHQQTLADMSQLLRDAELDAVEISPDSITRGRLIRELQLRTLTGASIVGIDRGKLSIVNPGPDEELQSGDRVLLLGKRSQLDRARLELGQKLAASPA